MLDIFFLLEKYPEFKTQLNNNTNIAYVCAVNSKNFDFTLKDIHKILDMGVPVIEKNDKNYYNLLSYIISFELENPFFNKEEFKKLIRRGNDCFSAKNPYSENFFMLCLQKSEIDFEDLVYIYENTNFEEIQKSILENKTYKPLIEDFLIKYQAVKEKQILEQNIHSLDNSEKHILTFKI